MREIRKESRLSTPHGGRFNWIGRLVFAICLLLGPGSILAAASDLETTIEADKDLGAAGSVVFTVHNWSQYRAKVLTWYTPLEKRFNSNMFMVYKDSRKVAYTGRLVKRGKPQESDYVFIEPGASLSATISLPEGYEMQEAGLYETTFNGIMQYQLLGKALVPGNGAQKIRKAKQSNKLLLQVTSPPKVSGAYKQAPTYSACTTANQIILDQALTEAENLALQAYDTLSSTPLDQRATAGRYRAWFGTYTNARYQTALNHFEDISTTLSDRTIKFNCDCTEDYFAWVYPNQPYEIHLCNSFWDAGLTGTDSQAGTIVHELSHFTVVVGTEDHVYGHGGALELAVTDPANALDNADNHEYFTENSPTLPMIQMLTLEDIFSSAYQAPGATIYAIGDSRSGSKENGEPDHAGNPGGKSMWLSWLAPATGSTTVSTLGTGIDTLLAVYTGNAVNNLNLVTDNDDYDYSASIYQSQLSFSAVAGQTYQIAVDGYGGEGGIILLSITTDFGDIDGDGSLSLEDGIIGLRLLSGQTEGQSFSREADINGDGQLGLQEALFILNQLPQ